MLYNSKKMPSTDKPIKVNINATAKTLQTQLFRYMVSVEHKIDGRSREKFWSIFKNGNKPKLVKTYEELKKQVEQHEPQAPKITMGMVKPSGQTDYLLNVVLYSDTPNFTGQRPYQGLYMMFPKDPHRQYQVKATKIFPQNIMRRIVRLDRTKREANLFRLGLKLFSTDEEFKELYDKKVII